MTLAEQAPAPMRWTGAQYDLAVQAGVFIDQRLELIDGEILQMALVNDPRAQAISLVEMALRPSFPPDQFILRIQCPLRLGSESRPEPDIAVVSGSARQVSRHPFDALLIVEVADATVFYDRTVKRKLYARHQIAEYWIVNLIAGNVEVHRNPISDHADPHYAEIRALSPTDTISPLAAPDAKIWVSDLLP